jgi:hypothetical protein
MVGLELDGRGKRRRPVRRRLSGDAVDEVDAHARESRSTGADEGVAPLRDRVAAGERGEVHIAERLDPEADARHARLAQTGPVGSLPSARVRLERHLVERRVRLPPLTRGVDDAGHRIRPEQRWRSATEVDRPQASGRRAQGELGDQRVDIARDRCASATDGHEVAVGADEAAERDVDVEMVRRPGRAGGPVLDAAAQIGRWRSRPPAKAKNAMLTAKWPTMAGITDPVWSVAIPAA